VGGSFYKHWEKTFTGSDRCATWVIVSQSGVISCFSFVHFFLYFCMWAGHKELERLKYCVHKVLHLPVTGFESVGNDSL